jgi:hypothetical protein
MAMLFCTFAYSPIVDSLFQSKANTGLCHTEKIAPHKVTNIEDDYKKVISSLQWSAFNICVAVTFLPISLCQLYCVYFADCCTDTQTAPLFIISYVVSICKIVIRALLDF